ncbi:DUF2179 domain-containing protein [Lysinibacillus sp. SGAir0095]|uniref:DUF2179 domain-containing protein n=1 Tax=Lysinibacillus sp. SGAir0095 TaxID=2070463 RepID=UPI0010CCFFCA|nr:DUF5698 domain-containing protein [Lysinibacillus sp. SGAir0095]QCR33099.1 hypothetical protein C1N55_13325 [Lysinibacillus sp. SGAir0095]
MEFLIILFAKVIEVSLSTVRTVFISKGMKGYSSFIAFIEVLIWLKVVSVVLIDISENPANMVAYAIGFAIGNYIGIWLESKLAIGLITIQVIVDESVGQELANYLRSQNVAVTVMHGEGRDTNRSILILHLKRKIKDKVIQDIEQKVDKALITASDVKVIHGGYGLLRK